MATVCVSSLNSDTQNLQNCISSQHQPHALNSSRAESSTFFDTPAITALSDNNVVMMLLFSHKPTLEWEQFKSAAAYHLRAQEDDLEVLKPILGANEGSVNAIHFSKFLRWFTPLVPEIENGTKAWRISSIAKLIRQPWFHGFALDSNHRLKPCPAGTFLIRFSSQAPHFVLALKDQSTAQVVEWRVVSMSGTVRLVESERFTDLQQLVDNYGKVVPTGASCPLQTPCPRS